MFNHSLLELHASDSDERVLIIAQLKCIATERRQISIRTAIWLAFASVRSAHARNRYIRLLCLPPALSVRSDSDVSGRWHGGI